MLRLTLIAQTPHQAVLKVDGQITVDQISTLTEEIGRLREQSTSLMLELDNVSHIDPEGLELLKQQAGPSLRLRGGSLFLRALLESNGIELADTSREPGQ